MNKAVYLGFSILELSMALMYEYSHDYVKPKYDEKTKVCSMDLIVYGFIVHIKIDDI